MPGEVPALSEQPADGSAAALLHARVGEGHRFEFILNHF